jgi:putative heme iron utilization protein
VYLKNYETVDKSEIHLYIDVHKLEMQSYFTLEHKLKKQHFPCSTSVIYMIDSDRHPLTLLSQFMDQCEKLTDDGRQVMAKAHIAFGKVS